MSIPAGQIPPAGPSSEDRTWAMAAHLLGILTSFTGLGFIGPLVVWMIKRDESAFVTDQAKESLNFQLTLLILSVVLLGITVVTCGVGVLVALPFWLAVPIVNLILCLIAGIAANEGKYYRYPFAWRLVQ